MFTRWDKKLDILGPIAQARRCLDIWLKEEKRRLPRGQKQRVAALLARYFYHEDETTDQIMLSFLRHYSGRHEVDMEDPAAVRMEIKSVLDQSRLQGSFFRRWPLGRICRRPCRLPALLPGLAIAARADQPRAAG